MRTALVYLINDLLGMVIWGSVFYIVNAFVHFPFMSMTMSPVKIAFLNTVYRMLTVLVLAPFIKRIEILVFRLVKDSEEDIEEQADFDLLEERFLQYPPLAIEQSQLAMNGMAKKARKNILRAISLMDSFSEEKYNKVQEKEALIDKYEDKLGTFLMQLTGKELSDDQTREVSKFLHTISDFERLGDHAVNLSKVSLEIYEKKLELSPEALEEKETLEAAVVELVNNTTEAFIENDLKKAETVEPLREWIGIMCNDIKLRHVSRLSKGKCEIQRSIAYNDMLTNMERIAAHCSNIAVAMVELEESEFDTHEYLKELRDDNNSYYRQLFDSYEAKYNILGSKKSKKKAKS